MNVIYLLLFKFPQTLDETNLKGSYYKLFDVLLKKYIKKNHIKTADISPLEKLQVITEREKVKLQNLIT